MRNAVVRGAAALALGSSLVLATATTAGAEEAGPGVERFEVVADHLNNPRQIAVHAGAVYVAEAGTGGEGCPPGAPCIGFSGSVTRVRDGRAKRIQTGLLSVSAPEGDVVGVNALTFRGDQLYGIASGACDLAGAPPEAIAQAGKLLRLDGGTRVRAVADVSTIECTTDPDGQGPDTNPYGVAVRGGSFFVADAGGNDVVRIAHGTTSVAAVLSKAGQPVPTSLTFGPDGGLYIGTLNFEGGPGQAAVYRLDVHTGELTTYARGLSAVTGLAFDRQGRLYVSEWTTGFDQNGPSPDGDVVVIPPGGGQEGRRVLGAGRLHFPTGVAVDRTGVYVSNWGIAPGTDGPFGPGNHGQLVRISSGAAHDCDDQLDTSRD